MKKMRKNKLLLSSFFALLGLIIVELIIYANFSKITEDEILISFVVTGDNLDAWETMKSGAQTATLDTGSQATFLNSPVSAGAKGEIELIERQLNEGADYVIVASGFFEEVSGYVEENNLSGKVFFVKNGDTNIKNGIITDDYSLGQDYASFIMDKSSDDNLLILYTDESITNEKIIEGLQDGFEGSGVNINLQHLKSDDDVITHVVSKEIIVGNYDGAIVLDSNILDAAVGVKGLSESGFHIYGVDDRQAAVYYLDSDLIKALACKDDYTIGFLAVKQVLSKEKEDVSAPLYYIVEREDIYSEQYEKVLFPFAK